VIIVPANDTARPLNNNRKSRDVRSGLVSTVNARHLPRSGEAGGVGGIGAVGSTAGNATGGANWDVA
jgi:hypothetical protein